MMGREIDGRTDRQDGWEGAGSLEGRWEEGDRWTDRQDMGMCRQSEKQMGGGRQTVGWADGKMAS